MKKLYFYSGVIMYNYNLNLLYHERHRIKSIFKKKNQVCCHRTILVWQVFLYHLLPEVRQNTEKELRLNRGPIASQALKCLVKSCGIKQKHILQLKRLGRWTTFGVSNLISVLKIIIQDRDFHGKCP